MVIYEKDGKLNINVVDGTTSNSQVTIEKDGEQAKVLVNGAPISGGGGVQADTTLKIKGTIADLESGEIEVDEVLVEGKTWEEVYQAASAGQFVLVDASIRGYVDGQVAYVVSGHTCLMVAVENPDKIMLSANLGLLTFTWDKDGTIVFQ